MLGMWERMTKPVYILNGPNLNLLGQRQPEIYGATTLQDIDNMCSAHASKIGLSVVFRQSNHEGELVDLDSGSPARSCWHYYQCWGIYAHIGCDP